MAMVVDEVRVLSVGTGAQTVDVGYRAFMIRNNSANTLYFKERDADGKACTAANGFPVPAGTMPDVVLRAKSLSVIASAASSDVRILFMTEE